MGLTKHFRARRRLSPGAVVAAVVVAAGLSALGSAPVFAAAPAATDAAPCRSANLRVAFGTDGYAGMSQTWGSLRFTNSGDQACTVQGFPAVSYIDGAAGTTVGLPAEQTAGLEVTSVTLDPGATTTAGFHTTSWAVYDATLCAAVPVTGYLVTPPNETAPLYLPFAAGSTVQACSGDIGRSLLRVGPMGTTFGM